MLNSARIFTSPTLLCSLLVGFRSLEQNLLRRAFQKPLKFLIHRCLTRSSLKSSSAAITASLTAHLYLSLALILFSLNIPDRGHPLYWFVVIVTAQRVNALSRLARQYATRCSSSRRRRINNHTQFHVDAKNNKQLPPNAGPLNYRLCDDSCSVFDLSRRRCVAEWRRCYS